MITVSRSKSPLKVLVFEKRKTKTSQTGFGHEAFDPHLWDLGSVLDSAIYGGGVCWVPTLLQDFPEQSMSTNNKLNRHEK